MLEYFSESTKFILGRIKPKYSKQSYPLPQGFVVHIQDVHNYIVYLEVLPEVNNTSHLFATFGSFDS